MERVGNNARLNEVTIDNPLSDPAGGKGGDLLSNLRGRQEAPSDWGQTSFLSSKYQKTEATTESTPLSAGGTTSMLSQILDVLKEIVGMLQQLSGPAKGGEPNKTSETAPAEKPVAAENTQNTGSENQIFSQILSLLQDIISLLEGKVDKKDAGGEKKQVEQKPTAEAEKTEPPKNADSQSQVLSQILDILQQLVELLQKKLGVEGNAASPNSSGDIGESLKKLKEDLEKLSKPPESEQNTAPTEKTESKEASKPVSEADVLKSILDILTQLVSLLQKTQGLNKDVK